MSLAMYASVAWAIVLCCLRVSLAERWLTQNLTSEGASPQSAGLVRTDDIDITSGRCKEFYPTSGCNGVEPGEGRAAECLTQLLDEAGAGAVPVPDACQQDVYDYYIELGKSFSANLPLAKACDKDAARLCNSTNFFGRRENDIIFCLRQKKAELSKDCKNEVFKVEKAIANDYRADPILREKCEKDAEQFCNKVPYGGGRKQACLREKHKQLSFECGHAIIERDIMAGDDLRLSVRLYKNCLEDKKKFCEEIPPGVAQARMCLEDHRLDSGFSEACRHELELMMQMRVNNFRLDSRMEETCGKTIETLCAVGGRHAEEKSVSLCLQDHVHDIDEERCRSLVLHYQQMAAQDIRFNIGLAEACYDDRIRWCKNVQEGSARVIRCLEKNRLNLSASCRATLFDEEQRFSGNIDFQFPMKEACEKEVQMFCSTVPSGDMRVIRCLQENKRQKEFSKNCLQEVQRYEELSSLDWRLNFRLKKACAKETVRLCKGECTVEDGVPCGGKVLRCLRDKRDQIQVKACADEVLYYEKMEVDDYHNDVILATACRDDVEKYCRDVQSGEGRVHQCLRENRVKLSEACRNEELLLEEVEMENIELKPSLGKACQEERKMFCREVAPGSGRLFRCLAGSIGHAGFGSLCGDEIKRKLWRRQANWRLDPSLRRTCKEDVKEFCAQEDSKKLEKGLVYTCLVQAASKLRSGCQRELGRAMYMALFVWQKGAPLTSACDDDINRICLGRSPQMAGRPGAVGECLANVGLPPRGEESTFASPLSQGCLALVEVAEPPEVRNQFDDSLTWTLLTGHLQSLEAGTGVPMVNRNPNSGAIESIALTGWMAVLGLLALIVSFVAGAVYLYRHYAGVQDPRYTLVLKTRPPTRRRQSHGSS